MADSLNILLQAKLDEAKSLQTINVQIDHLATKLKELNLKIDLDSGELTRAKEKIMQLEKTITSEINQQNDVLKEQASTLDKIDKTYKVSADGTRKQTKEVEKHTVAIGKQLEVTKQWNKEKDSLVVTQEKETINYDKQRKTTAKLVKEQEKLERLRKNLISQGFIGEKETLGLKDKIFSSKNLEDLQQAKILYEELSTRSQILAGLSQTLTNRKKEEIEIEKKQAQAINKNIEAEEKRKASSGSLVGIFDNLKESGAEWVNIEKTLQQYYNDNTLKLTKYNETTGQLIYKRRESAKTEREYASTLSKTTGEIRNQSNAIKDISAKNLGFLEQFKIALMRVPIWIGAMTVFWGSLRSLQDGVQYITEIDTALTNLRKVSDENIETLREFTKTANELGHALGKTSADIIEATANFARLGYEFEEAQTLAQKTLLYSNVADVDVQTASDDIISAIKGFGVAVDEEGRSVEHLIDVYNEVGNRFAISSAGVGEAARRSASALYEAGNSLEQAVGMIAAANATIQDPAVVGTALKTISLRLRGVTEEGEEIAKLLPTLEGMFANIGITLRKDENTFKSTYEIMDELSQVWDSLTDFKQAQLLEAIAGKRQANIVASMIRNWEDARKATETGLNSFGSAVRENERYMESIEAKIQQFRNAIIGFWQENIDAEGFKQFVDMGTGLVKLFTLLTKHTGLLPPVIALVSLAIGGLNNSMRTMIMNNGLAITSIRTMTSSLSVLGAVATSVATFFKGAFLPVAAITAASFAVQKLAENYAELRQEREKIKQQNEELVDSYNKHSTQIYDLLTRYKELDSKVKMGTVSENDQEYVEIQNELNSLLPTLTARIDEKGNAHLKSGKAIDLEIGYIKELQEKYNQFKLDNFENELDGIIEKLTKARAESGQLAAKLLTGAFTDEQRSSLNLEKLIIDRQVFTNYNELISLTKEFINLRAEESGITANLTDTVWEYIDTLVEEQKETLAQEGKAQDLVDKMLDKIEVINNAIVAFKGLNKDSAMYKTEVQRIINSLKLVIHDQDILNQLLIEFGIIVDGITVKNYDLAAAENRILTTYEDAKNSLEIYNKLLSDVANGKKLSAHEAMDLIQKENELADAITIENGIVKVNIEAVEQQRKAKLTAFNDMAKAEKNLINAAFTGVQTRLRAIGIEIRGWEELTKAKNAYAAKIPELLKSEPEMFRSTLTAPNRAQQLFSDIDAIVDAKNRIDNLINMATGGLSTVGVETGSSSGSGSSAAQSAQKYERQLKANFNLLQKIAQAERNITDLQNKRELLSDTSDIRENILQEMAATQELYRQTEKLANIQGDQRKKLFSQMTAVSKSVVSVSKDYNVLTVNAKEYNKLTDKQKEKIDDLISSYDDLNNAYHDNIQKKLELKATIKDLNNELDELIQRAKDEYQEWKDEVSDVADDIIDTYKDFYEKQKEVKLAEIDEEIKAEEERHDRKMDNLKEELDKYEEIIDAKLKLLDAEADEEDYNKNLTNLQKDRQEIQNKINVLSLDDSIEAKAQREELSKQLAEKEESIEELKANRTRELRKKNLQKLLEDYKKEIKAKQDSENKKYEATKQRLQDERKEIEDYYNNIINNERKFAKIREDILDGNLKNIRKDFADFADFIKENSELIGESLSQNLIDKMRDAGDALSNIDYDEGRRKKDDAEEAEKKEKEKEKYSQYKQTLKSILYWKQQWERANASTNAKYKAQIKAQAEEAAQQYYAKLPSDLKSKVKGMNASALENFINTLHTGGVVGRATGLSALFNKLFNTAPNEQIVKMLENELAIPEVNLKNNAIPNLQNLISRNKQGNVIHVDKVLEIENFYNNTDTDIDKLLDRATDKFIRNMYSKGHFATVRG